MNRTARRKLMRQTKMPWELFKNRTPTHRALPPLVYWAQAPEPVMAHIYDRCPTLFKEWAGRSELRPKVTNEYMARLLTAGLCGQCNTRWRAAIA